MSLKNTNPTVTTAWKKLREHFQQICYTPIQELFEQDKMRVTKFHIRWNDFLLDYSKNKINKKTIELFIELAQELDLKNGIENLFSGKKINQTENRAVLHTALRADKSQNIKVDGKNIILEIQKLKQKIKSFSEKIINGKQKGFSDKIFTDVVNIGIGGSDLGPKMVNQALYYYKNHLNIHYISNVDGDRLVSLLEKLNPETTLFIVVSKTFTTQETLTNAQTIRKWFLEKASTKDISKHFIAVSSNLEKVKEFGILEENIFPLWDWVGGRFSLWSSVGISIALAVGYNNFEKLLQGANNMDNHFRTADFDQNIPVILAFLSIWYNNFFEAQTHCVVAYSDYLKEFIPYLQQLSMESNGKCVSRKGIPVNTHTGNVVFGGIGTDVQHAFFQLLHQGTKLIPTDFIGFSTSLYGNKEHHNILMANFFAQTEALLNGKENTTNPFADFYGDKPSNTILIRQLTPENLGSLLAIYEHKVFVEGYLWNIFSFDQFGVELGKELATNILDQINKKTIENHDSSTSLLLESFLK